MFVVILVAPQMCENIGFVARVMSNFGFDSLRIVTPRQPQPSQISLSVAAKGAYIIENASVHENIESAVDDCNIILATTAHERNLSKNMHDITQLTDIIEKKQKSVNANLKIGILFGRESSGLSNEEMALADYLFTIPTSQKNSSMNLSHAICIFLYEIVRGNLQNFKPIEFNRNEQIVDKSNIIQLINDLVFMLERRNFFKDPNKKSRLIMHITNIFMKAHWNKEEFSTVYGMLKRLGSDKLITPSNSAATLPKHEVYHEA